MRAYRRTLGIVAGAALLLGAARAAAQTPMGTAKPVAVVNGETISAADMDGAIAQILRTPSTVELTETKRRQLQVQALGILIDDVLFKQFLRQNGPRIDPAEVEKMMAGLEAGLKADGKTLKDYCRENCQTEAQVRASTLSMLQWQAYLKNRLTEADLKRYYDENRAFFDDVHVRASHIVLHVQPAATEAERQAARNKLLELRQKIVANQLDFAEAAKKYSECPSAPKGGDLGQFERKFDVDETFARAAFALKVGEVSDVVQTDFGLHLIKVTERTPGKPSDFAKVKDHVLEMCDLEMRMAVIAQQRQKARIEVNLP